MKTINVVSYSSNLLASILALIIGVVLFNRPELLTMLISYICGSLFILTGLFKIIYYSYQKGKSSDYPAKDLLLALCFIVFGGLCIFLSSAIEQAVRFLVGGYILFAGINRLIRATELPDKKGNKFFSVLIVSLLLIALGVVVIFVSNIIGSALGIVLIIYSVLEILNYIFVVRNNHERIYVKENEDVEKDIKQIKTVEAEVIETKSSKKKKK